MARPPLYLVVGPAELLVQRYGERLLDELREEGEIEVVEVAASQLAHEPFPDLRTGSLFGARRVVVVRQAGELPADAAARLTGELEAGPLDATVILLATSTQRLQKVARVAKELGGRVDVETPSPYDERGWQDAVAEEFGRHGRQATRAAIAAVLAHAGTDIALIAEKVAQACAATPPGMIDAEHVDAVVTGHGSRGAFAIADAMCKRQPVEAVTLLRGALEAGDDPVMILGALAYRLRSIVAVAGGIESGQAGLSISRAQRPHLERDRRRFGPGELTRAYRLLADADAEVKGGELPPAVVLERAVAAIAAPRAAEPADARA
jgi:DNA polymerase III subunit delta